jgi:hypothetical protein
MARLSWGNTAPKVKSDYVIELEKNGKVSELLEAIQNERVTDGKIGSSGSVKVTRLGSSGNMNRKLIHR